MPTYVADATALLAYLLDEQGAELVAAILSDDHNDIYAHAVNVCEIYYDVLRDRGRFMAEEAVARLRLDGVKVREDMDAPFWMDVGSLKVNPGSMSLADCFGLALARRLQCEFLTADHHELDKIAHSSIAKITFIR